MYKSFTLLTARVLFSFMRHPELEPKFLNQVVHSFKGNSPESPSAVMQLMSLLVAFRCKDRAERQQNKSSCNHLQKF